MAFYVFNSTILAESVFYILYSILCFFFILFCFSFCFSFSSSFHLQFTLNDFRPTLICYLCSPYTPFHKLKTLTILSRSVFCAVSSFLFRFSFSSFSVGDHSYITSEKRLCGFKKWHFRDVPYSIYAVILIVGGSEKVQKCADVVYGWTLVYVSHAKWRQGHPRVVIHYIHSCGMVVAVLLSYAKFRKSLLFW